MPSRTTRPIPEYTSLEDILAQAIDHEQESHDYYVEAAKRTAEIGRVLALGDPNTRPVRHRTDGLGSRGVTGVANGVFMCGGIPIERDPLVRARR